MRNETHITACTTLDQSFRLGAVTGALAGAAATYASHGANGRNPSPEEVGLGATIGLGLGLVASQVISSINRPAASENQKRPSLGLLGLIICCCKQNQINPQGIGQSKITIIS